MADVPGAQRAVPGGGPEPRDPLDCWACAVLVTAQNLLVAAFNLLLLALVLGTILLPAVTMLGFGFLCHSQDLKPGIFQPALPPPLPERSPSIPLGAAASVDPMLRKAPTSRKTHFPFTTHISILNIWAGTCTPSPQPRREWDNNLVPSFYGAAPPVFPGLGGGAGGEGVSTHQ
ncbi:transmembrane protein 88 isoform X2 [Macaca fascicularis]|uniref:transmembrane protein 88 isoform X2 n=1 Tax=Macaca fascicularis TaxID=9541 RepID=UPI0032B044BA